MIRAILVDDEPKNIRILRGLLETFCPEVTIIAEATSANEAIELIRKDAPDLLLLDIEMPYGNAFDLLDAVMPVSFEIVFVTAFDDYTLKAFKYSALDYILKPVNIEELKAAVAKTAKRIEHKHLNQQLSNLRFNLGESQALSRKMAISTKDGYLFVKVGEIVACEAKGGYSIIHLEDGRRFMVQGTIKVYEEMLPESAFFRVHNSYIANLHFVKKYYKGRGGTIEMSNGIKIEVAARRKDEFLSRLHNI